MEVIHHKAAMEVIRHKEVMEVIHHKEVTEDIHHKVLIPLMELIHPDQEDTHKHLELIHHQHIHQHQGLIHHQCSQVMLKRPL
jgi:hypothetical protein